MKKTNVTKTGNKKVTKNVTIQDENFVNGNEVTIESETVNHDWNTDLSEAVHDQATEQSVPIVDEREKLIKRAHAARLAALVGLMTQEEAEEHWEKAVIACKPTAESLEILETAKKAKDKAEKVHKAARIAFEAGLIDEDALDGAAAKADTARADYTDACRAAKGFSMNGGGPRYKGQMSGIEAAFQILTESEKPLNPSTIVRVAIERGLWTPDGLTPAATLSAAIQADAKKGDKSRFIKTGPGHY